MEPAPDGDSICLGVGPPLNVKSTDPAISPFHKMAEKMSGRGAFIFCSQFQKETELAQQKEAGKDDKHAKQTNGAILRVEVGRILETLITALEDIIWKITLQRT